LPASSLALDVSLDGKVLAVACAAPPGKPNAAPAGALLFDLETLRLRKRLPDARQTVLLSPDGRFLVAAKAGAKKGLGLHLFDAQSGKALAPVPDKHGRVCGFTIDGAALVCAGGPDKGLVLLDVQSLKPRAAPQGPLALLRHGDRLVVRTGPLWQHVVADQLRKAGRKDGAGTALAWTADGKGVIVGGGDWYHPNCWDLDKRAWRGPWQLREPSDRALSFCTPDGRLVLSPQQDGIRVATAFGE
jgi:hypothetical protein